MLAWVHEAIAAEREFLEALFSIKEDGFREPILRSLSHAPDAALRYSRERTDQTDSNLYLFIVTTNHVLVHQATGRGTGSSAVMVVDEIGAGLGCAVMNESNMIVARDEAIYMCAIEGRGNAFDYEGNKSAIHVHSSYLVIISPPFVASAFAASTTVCNFIRATGDDISEISKVTVFDHANKFVAYSGTFSQGLTHLIEKSTSAKLDMLYKRSLYGLALNLAKTKNVDDSHVEDIHRQYGDHLYPSKNDYDGAMTQYVKTLGWVQPRQAGYFEHAGYLAKKYERHEDYLSIQIEDAGKYSEALLYLRKLVMDDAEGSLACYGRASALGGASYLSFLTLHRNSIARHASENVTVAALSVKTVRVGDTQDVAAA
ncbi:hypothetical protein F5051DRAFT_446114 [Lentinula edodes]|nr:hypothetical protein F5051DRAFT_446114 [Lentinula edodes]